MNNLRRVPARHAPEEGDRGRALSAVDAERDWVGGFREVMRTSLSLPEGEPFRWGEATCRAVAQLNRGQNVELSVRSRDPWFAVLTRSSVPAPPHDPLEAPAEQAPVAVSEPVCLPDEESRLRVELSGVSPAAGPAWTESNLRVLVVALAAVYEERVVAPLLRRRRLLDGLAPVQRSLLPFLLSGASEVRVAELTGRSRHTVHDHTKKIYKRLGIHNRHELVTLWHGLDTHSDVVAPPRTAR